MIRTGPAQVWPAVRVPDRLCSDTEESVVGTEVTQPLLGVRDRDGRQIEPAVVMARRLEALEQRLRELEQG